MTVGSDKVLILRTPALETTKSGILTLPDAVREKPDYGEVIAVGSDVKDWKVGDKVYFPRWVGFQVLVPKDDRDLLVVWGSEIWFSE